MTTSTVKKFVFTPLLISAVVFGALSVPLHIFGSKSVDIKLKDEPIFFGELKEFSPQYMQMTGVLSATAGILCLAVMGWKQASRKSVQVEAEISNLAESLQEKQKLLEALKQTESRLKDSLTKHQSDQVPQLKLTPIVTETGKEIQSPETLMEVHREAKLVEPLVITQPIVQPVTSVLEQAKVSAAAAKFASAQTFLGYTQAKNTIPSSPTNDTDFHSIGVNWEAGEAESAGSDGEGGKTINSLNGNRYDTELGKVLIDGGVKEDKLRDNQEIEDLEIEEIESQLQQIVEQIASLQDTLRTNPKAVSAAMRRRK